MIRLSRVARTLLAVAALGGGPSCKKDSAAPEPPQEGPLSVMLTSPNAEDGAVLFIVIGAIDSVTTPAGSALQVISNTAVERTVLVRGPIAPGAAIAAMWVKDVSVSYTASVTQVASRAYAQRTLAGYSLTVQKP